MKSTAQITTLDAQRIAKRLLNHWKHKFEVNQSENIFTIFMPEATLKLTAEAELLAVEIQTDRKDYSTLENVVVDHLNRMAQQQFEPIWQHLA